MIVNTEANNAAIRADIETFRKILRESYGAEDQEISLHLLGNAAFQLGHAGYSDMACAEAFDACYQHGMGSANHEKRSDP